MPILPKAPLVEAWVELRWGLKPHLNSPADFEFTFEDLDFFPGQFRKAAERSGFVTIERVNPEIVKAVPHVVTYRFRKAPATWPCYQIGTGMFTVNQINDGYKWETFKPDVVKGLQVLNEGHPTGLGGLSRFGIELRYQDGFPFTEGQTPPDFLKSNLEIGFRLVPEFMNLQQLSSEISGMKVGFSLNTSVPRGQLIIEIVQGTINAQPGFVMNTIVRSTQGNCPEWTTESISEWLESAHEIQRHAFKTLISPAFARTFK